MNNQPEAKLPEKAWLLKRIAELKIEIAKRLPGGWSTSFWERELRQRISELDQVKREEVRKIG